MWYVYILECEHRRLYTGITDDLKRRFQQHASGKGAKFTRAFKAKRLLFFEKAENKSAALKKEAHIKSLSRPQKLQLIRRP